MVRSIEQIQGRWKERPEDTGLETQPGSGVRPCDLRSEDLVIYAFLLQRAGSAWLRPTGASSPRHTIHLGPQGPEHYDPL